MGCTVGRTPGGLTAGRGRGVLGLGGLRACEGVRGRVRACFTLTQLTLLSKFEFLMANFLTKNVKNRNHTLQRNLETPNLKIS